MLGEVLLGFLVGCISVLWFLLTSRHEGGDEEGPSEPRAPAAARDACTAVFERLLEDVSRSEELRVLLEGKLQRALNPLSTSTSMLKMVTLTGLRYPHFRPRLANITQTPTEHADELRVEFDLWTEGIVTLKLRAVVQGGILPSMPVDLVLSIRSIRGRARLIIPPGRDPTLYLSFTSPPRLDMRVEAGKVRVEKLPYVGKLLLERVHQLINRHLVAPSGGIAFHFPIPKVRKLRFRMLSAPPPPLPPRVSPSASTADASAADAAAINAAANSPLEVLAEEREDSVATRVSAALAAETDAAAPLAPALLTSTLPASPPPVPARMHSSVLPSVPIAVPPAEPAHQDSAADSAATITTTPTSADAPLSALPLAAAAAAVDSTPPASTNAPLPALPLAAASPPAATTLPVVALASDRPASPPAPPSLSSSALFGPRSPTTTTATAAGAQPIPVPPAEPLASSSPPGAAASLAASVPSASASASASDLFSSLPLSEAPPPPVPARLRSESLYASGSSVLASASVTALPAPVSDDGAHSPAVPPRSLRPQLSRRLSPEEEAEAEERRLVEQGSASLLAAEARLQPETQLNIGRFVVDEYDASPSTSPPAVPPRPHAAPPPLPPRPSSLLVDD